MRTLTILLLAIMLYACAVTPVVPTSEEGRLQEAEQLVRFSLSERLMENVEKSYTGQLGAFLMSKDVPVEQVNQMVADEFNAIKDEEHQRLLDALVPIYRRYYTADEIHQLLSFYRTDVARKSLKVSTQIAAEGQAFLRLWNENFEQQLLERMHVRLRDGGLLLTQ